MSDAEIIVSAREAELHALFANLHRTLAGGDAFAPAEIPTGAAPART